MMYKIVEMLGDCPIAKQENWDKEFSDFAAARNEAIITFLASIHKEAITYAVIVNDEREEKTVFIIGACDA